MPGSNPMQCVVIEKDGQTPPPPPPEIPFNENSTRALSKKNRVYVLRDFLRRNYPSCTAPGSTVLDVAGGRGDLSWIMRNFDGVDSIIADPRIPNHRSLVKSVAFLLEHPEEAAMRAVEGLPTHQPLAKLLLRLRGANDSGSERNHFASPKFMRMHVDNTLVETLREVLCASSSEEDGVERGLKIWDECWQREKCRISSNKVLHYGGTAPKSARTKAVDEESSQISGSREALVAFQSLNLIVGFHPDQATETTIDLALMQRIPFAVVPCCVFPSEFPDRTFNGSRVRAHGEFIEYLCAKDSRIRRGKLPFVETDTAKNTVLYMLKEDYQ